MPRATKQNPIGPAMQQWLVRARDASGFLSRLYLELKDPVQRDRALQAGAFAREQTKGVRTRPSGTAPPWIVPDRVQGERLAWLALLEGLLGLHILVALSGPAEPDQTTPLHRRLNRALQAGLQGFITAFPGDLVEQDLDRLCDAVIGQASEIANQAWIDVRKPEEEQVDVRVFLQEQWSREIKPSLLSLNSGTARSGKKVLNSEGPYRLPTLHKKSEND